MLKSTGLVLTASGIVVANDLLFAPTASSGKGNVSLASKLNWRIVPATAILALTLGGLEKLSEPLGVGLAGLVLLAVLVVPVGNSGTPLANLSTYVNNMGSTTGPSKASTATIATAPPH